VEGARQGNAGTRSRSALQCSYCSTRSGRQHRVSALCTGVLLCHRRSIVKVSVAPQDYPTSCWRCLSEDAAMHALHALCTLPSMHACQALPFHSPMTADKEDLRSARESRGVGRDLNLDCSRQ
jgi:hypothetical protein